MNKYPIFETAQHAYQILRMPEDVVCDPLIFRQPCRVENFQATEDKK